MTELRVFSANPMIADMDPLLRRVVGDGIELATIQGAGLWSIQLRSGELEQVLLALAVSACEGMPEGGTLRIATRNVRLDEEYVRRFPDVHPGEYVLLEVSDTGPGLTDAMKARVLESFLAPTAPGHATALAFSMSYGILRRAGGHLELLSAAGAGTTVRVYLPRANAPAGREDAREVAGLPRGTETVLIVEDEKSLLSVTGRALAHLGYGVLKAASGEEALRILGSAVSQGKAQLGVAGAAGSAQGGGQTIDLLLADIVLTGIDGLALSKQVRALQPGIKVVFMSGHFADGIRLRDAVEPGMTLLEKPFTLEALALTVRTALDSA